MRTVLAIPDCHMPFHNKTALSKVIAMSKSIKPDVIVQLGDLYDNYAHSKYPRSHNLMTPRREMEKAREAAEDMWSRLKKLNPKAECWQIRGNHSERIHRRILERYPEVEHLVSLKDLFKFDGVNTHFDVREPLEIDSVLYMHGHMSGLGKHAQYFLKSVVCGHTHTGGTVFIKRKNEVIFECNAGMLADSNSIPLSYTPSKLDKHTTGFAVIDNLGPRFVPL